MRSSCARNAIIPGIITEEDMRRKRSSLMKEDGKSLEASELGLGGDPGELVENCGLINHDQNARSFPYLHDIPL